MALSYSFMRNAFTPFCVNASKLCARLCSLFCFFLFFDIFSLRQRDRGRIIAYVSKGVKNCSCEMQQPMTLFWHQVHHPPVPAAHEHAHCLPAFSSCACWPNISKLVRSGSRTCDLLPGKEGHCGCLAPVAPQKASGSPAGRLIHEEPPCPTGVCILLACDRKFLL